MLLLVCGCDEVWDLEPVRRKDAATSGDPSLVAYFPMDSIAGDRTENLVADHDGECVQPKCPSEIEGKYGQALVFDGATMIVDARSSSALDMRGSFTVALWARIDAAPFSSFFGCAVSKRWSVGDINTWQICASPTVWVVYTTTSEVTGPVLDLGRWHHIAATWDVATGLTQLYLDGEPGGVSVTGNTDFDTGSVLIGADIDYGGPVAWFPGALDELRIYNRVLAHAEIYDLYAQN